MVNKCPYCSKASCVSEVVFRNCEALGDRVFHLPCLHCGKMIRVSVARTVKVQEISMSLKPRSESDF